MGAAGFVLHEIEEAVDAKVVDLDRKIDTSGNVRTLEVNLVRFEAVVELLSPSPARVHVGANAASNDVVASSVILMVLG